MTDANEEAREAQVNAIMKGGDVEFKRYVLASIMAIQENCKTRCAGMSVVDRWTPTAVGTALLGIGIGLYEYFTKRSPQ
jgi:hypothetical protein